MALFGRMLAFSRTPDHRGVQPTRDFDLVFHFFFMVNFLFYFPVLVRHQNSFSFLLHVCNSQFLLTGLVLQVGRRQMSAHTPFEDLRVQIGDKGAIFLGMLFSIFSSLIGFLEIEPNFIFYFWFWLQFWGIWY